MHPLGRSRSTERCASRRRLSSPKAVLGFHRVAVPCTLPLRTRLLLVRAGARVCSALPPECTHTSPVLSGGRIDCCVPSGILSSEIVLLLRQGEDRADHALDVSERVAAELAVSADVIEPFLGLTTPNVRMPGWAIPSGLLFLLPPGLPDRLSARRRRGGLSNAAAIPKEMDE